MAIVDKEKLEIVFTEKKEEDLDIKSSDALGLLIEILYEFSDDDELDFLDIDEEEVKA